MLRGPFEISCGWLTASSPRIGARNWFLTMGEVEPDMVAVVISKECNFKKAMEV